MSKEGVVPILITPTTRNKLRTYKHKHKLKNYTEAIKTLLEDKHV